MVATCDRTSPFPLPETLTEWKSVVGQGVFWSGRRDLNPRPPVPQTGALTGLRHAPTGTARTIGMRLWPRNNAPPTAFHGRAGGLTDCARLFDVIPFERSGIETRPWPKLSQHDLTRISASIRRPRDHAPARSPAAVPGDIRLAVYEDMSAIERDWRAFEAHADGTVFQCFDWLASWQRHIGVRNGVRPAIVVGRDAAGAILFLLPLSVRSAGFARELTWLGSELCDYNAPLLAPGFLPNGSTARGFLSLWADITQCLQSNPRLRFDFINLTKMPEMVGAQPNPMLGLRVTMTPSGAYLTHLAGDWETFYAAKRSSATRRRDRTKRKKLAEYRRGHARSIRRATAKSCARSTR